MDHLWRGGQIERVKEPEMVDDYNKLFSGCRVAAYMSSQCGCNGMHKTSTGSGQTKVPA